MKSRHSPGFRENSAGEKASALPLGEALRRRIDSKTKPLGALGRLESLARRIGEAQGTVTPELRRPTVLVFAADHGIAAEGVSAYPREVTAQMVLNFLRGGAAINVFCRQNGLDLQVVDAGVDFDFPPGSGLLPAKVGRGTRNFLYGPAMTGAELDECFRQGAALVESLAQAGCNTVGFGEMGIGNTSSAALLMSRLCGLPLEACTGRGTGLTAAQFERKLAVLQRAQAFHAERDGSGAGGGGGSGEPAQADAGAVARKALLAFGGFEIAQMAAAMRAAFDRNMLLLVDGFISSVAFLAALRFEPALRKNAVFCHLSEEQGHRALLEYLGAEPLLRLDLRLGEGTGCALAFPLLRSAVGFLNEMASFESAGVSGRQES